MPHTWHSHTYTMDIHIQNNHAKIITFELWRKIDKLLENERREERMRRRENKEKENVLKRLRTKSVLLI